MSNVNACDRLICGEVKERERETEKSETIKKRERSGTEREERDSRQ